MSWFTTLLAAPRRYAARAFRSVRRAWDRALHPRRHSVVKTRLRGGQRPRSILVVCHGNICRSPYLAAVLARALPDVEVASAGFIGAGRTVPEHSRTVASRKGLDLASHRSQLVTHQVVSRADLVIAMDGRQAAFLSAGFGVSSERIVIAGDLDPRPGTTRAIQDPWHKALDVFEASFARLDRCAESLVTLITTGPRRS